MTEKDKKIGKIANERLRLLSRKHNPEVTFTEVDAERLKQLTEELNILCPRVSEEDWKSLRDVRKELEKRA